MIEARSLTLEGLRHGFFSRDGGVSRPPYDSLNCGLGSADAAEAVSENRQRAMARLGLAAEQLTTVYQVHGTDVVTVEAPWAAAASPQADALVTRQPGIALGVLTADCAPVLLADAEAGVVAAAHAGWRGALAGIVSATIERMGELGARPAATRAAVGPCIGQDSYQVGPEFPAAFVAADAANERFFVAGAGEKFHFDLEGFVVAELAAAGVGHVEALALDTCADGERFFSYRRSRQQSEEDYGRLLSAIALEE
ncbi:MAG TPA: peptidoglycan editing factor PgeF [Alphaproteobacteria bacterium]|jgi:hypothetical protein|nr:peptidoglycan editing factor PgeF [Alphaproteobacteria bacterium]MDP6270045.1 peptidoglycan editing factor PgeF [Alphaproteobacteria bacterium]MDP7164228.1 peptidoglycan editing factor PgeF [Alphaproteobacteria bacterium]MDP7429650.1 peptidoglycan editing factor PgeF [Alphaproteobacteria bacterium]HJM48496.1 peptidoglycan editing factor PgeF [Alphaproteobacteria bacterium]